MLPSVDATMMVLPEDDGPNSFDRSTLIVKMFPSTDAAPTDVSRREQRTSSAAARIVARRRVTGYSARPAGSRSTAPSATTAPTGRSPSTPTGRSREPLRATRTTPGLLDHPGCDQHLQDGEDEGGDDDREERPRRSQQACGEGGQLPGRGDHRL